MFILLVKNLTGVFKNAECSADFKTVEKVAKNLAQNAISQKL
jgi:hypothetical protein